MFDSVQVTHICKCEGVEKKVDKNPYKPDEFVCWCEECFEKAKNDLRELVLKRSKDDMINKNL